MRDIFPPKNFYWLATLSILFGLILLVVAFFVSDPHSSYHNVFWAYLATNLGGLFVFGASYSLISEGHLKKDFARQMATSIDSRMVKIQLDSTILAAGLAKIIPSFSHHELHGRLEQSSTVKMVVMRNDTYFRDYCDAIRDRIQHSNLDLHVLMPDPRDRDLMTMLAKRYDVYNVDQLTASVQKSIQDWLQGAVYDNRLFWHFSG